MNTPETRRSFIQKTAFSTAAVGLGISALSRTSIAGANDKLVVAVMGTNGRGMDHINNWLSVPNVEIGYVCDVDTRAMEKGIAAISRKQARAPKGIKDIRTLLEEKQLDLLSIAAPNHWHAPATIMSCAAGKHVYVEKPCSHNPHEGELMLQAARKHKRMVQMGNQRRSWGWMIEAIQRLHAGEIGKVVFARTWYNNVRGTIGRGKPAPVPEWLDYPLWQGPAPEKAFVDNLIHYNWHWRWHWGNGELGNNGIHALDVARWGLHVDYPRSVSCGGNRYHFEDDQETPDIYVTNYDFGHCGATWESHSCDPHGFEGAGFGINFYGKEGTVIIAGSQCRILDSKGKVVREIAGPVRDADHFANLADGIRNGTKLNSEIEEGVKSTLWCHLGNIAWRTGHVLKVDSSNGKIVSDKEALKLWSREYRKGWEPKV